MPKENIRQQIQPQYLPMGAVKQLNSHPAKREIQK